MGCAIAILAGGRGRRLGGVDKALLVVGGQTLLARQLAVARPLFDEILLVGGDPGRARAQGVGFVADRRPGAGPLAGLEAALAATAHDQVVALGCDLPFPDAGLLRLVRDHAPGRTVAPRIGGRAQPLHARYPRAALAEVTARLDRGHRRLVDLLAALDPVYLEESALIAAADDPSLRGLSNINTPADLATLG
jgi:molybdopterin-guanine dinucleotide biosynthesis protein A